MKILKEKKAAAEQKGPLHLSTLSLIKSPRLSAKKQKFPSAEYGLKKLDLNSMPFRSKFDRDGSSSREGHEAEMRFEDYAKKKGYVVTPSTKKENKYDHIDFFLEGKTGTVSIDLKARKRTSRKDKKFNDDWIWLEIKNVQGREGWLYGKADFIVFETEKSFVLAPRKKLIELANEKVRFDLFLVDRAYQAKYRIYQRPKRRDQITQVELKEILKLKNVTVWNKNGK